MDKYELEKTTRIKKNGVQISLFQAVLELNKMSAQLEKYEAQGKTERLSLVANGYKVEDGKIVFERELTTGEVCRKEFPTLEAVAEQLNLMADNVYNNTFGEFLEKLMGKK